MKKIFFFLFAALLFSSCASVYDPAPQLLPEHVKKVYVRPFTNGTNQFGLEARFTNAVIDEILRDGRLSLVNTEAEADGVLTAVIKRYILQPLTYDINMVPELYKLWIIVSVSFIDKTNNVTLWTEPNMEGLQIYKNITAASASSSSNFSSNTDGMAEEDARQLIWDKLARNIVTRTVKGFGSVTSVSDKKVPN